MITEITTTSNRFGFCLYPNCTVTVGGVASVGERVTFSSPDENARAGEKAPSPNVNPHWLHPLLAVVVNNIQVFWLLFYKYCH